MSFNYEFAKEDEEYLIKLVQKTRGCFNLDCGNPSAKKQCTKCRVAVYCSKECQLKDWKDKRCPHKEICKVYLKDTARSTEPELNGQKGSVAIALLGTGIIHEEICSKALTDRTNAFLEEAKRCMNIVKKNDEYGFRSANSDIGIAACCIHDIGKVRLVCAATCFDPEMRKVMVNHVVYEAVGEGGVDVRRRLHPPRGSGDIPTECRTRVLETLTAFVRRTNEEFGIQIQSITYGRGLMWLREDEDYKDAKEEMDNLNGTAFGVTKRIMWMPDMSYAMEDVGNTFMSSMGLGV